jgi:D-alanyl-D-alanine carboxypeptidase
METDEGAAKAAGSAGGGWGAWRRRVVQGDGGPRQAASGVADLRTGRPMRPGLHFRAGSLTKSLVATVVLLLVAEGRLSLQDTLQRWLPGILPYGEQVTIRQLLDHTSGVPHNWAAVEQTLYRSSGGRFRVWTPRELVALVADQPPSFPPGTAWSYSNTGYLLLGLVVEAASRSTLGQELHRRIFGPLGLHGTASHKPRLASRARARAATAFRWVRRGSRWMARCWTSRPRTHRGLGRRARWCPTWRT